MTVQTDTLYCFGFGYVARHLALGVLKRGTIVFGTTRSQDKAADIDDLGDFATGVVFKSDDARIVPVPHAHWLVSIPPDASGCPAFRAVSDDISTARTITYLSTTGVYGDHGGRWVTELTPVSPQSERAKRRVIAENQWQSAGANIVRLPGIYGPGRSAFDRLRAGTARCIRKPGQVFSRIHVEDIAAGLLAIMQNRHPDLPAFHLCDDTPAPPQDVIAHAAQLLGMPAPPEEDFESADLSPMARSFYSECKRVSNAETKRALGWQPRYRSYRDGLAAILRHERLT